MSERSPWSRRRFLGVAAAGTAGVAAFGPLGACSSDDGQGTASSTTASGPIAPSASSTATFPDGVMAGDPRPDGAVIWTRADPSLAGTDVLWEVVDDDGVTIVATGSVVPDDAADGSVRVLVTGLDPDRWYDYRFVSPDDLESPIGRLRTAPTVDSSPERLTFAWCSCQQINDSLYVAQRAMATEPDLDFFVHLGDYVYVNDQETLEIDDYREVYHRFKADPLLQQLQSAVPIVAMFDDGEFYNGVDATGDPARLRAAQTAWREAFPVADLDPEAPVYRSLVWGDLAELFMLDVRSYRDPAVDATDTATPEGAVALDADRTTLGPEQKAWLLDGLRESDAAWKVLGNPYNLSLTRFEDRDDGPPREPGEQVNAGNYFPNEAWDDYPAERRELLQAIVDDGVADVVSVSGHTHVWIAGLLQPDPDDPASPVAAFDFTCGSLTADPNVLDVKGSTPEAERPKQLAIEEIGLQINQHFRYLNFVDQGYGLAHVTPDEIILEFKLVDPFDEAAEAKVGARFVLPRGATDMVAETFDDARR